MKIMVTGCAGFIGSWISQKAINLGHQVVGIDNLSSGVNYTPNGVDFYIKDVNSDLSEQMSGVDAIVHCSAYAQLKDNWKDQSERKRLFNNNELATISILEQMPAVPLVFMSSASVYGSLYQIKNDIILEEDSNTYTIESPYAASKFACESYISAWGFKNNFPWYSLRLVNQIGARTHRGVMVDFCKKVKDCGHIHALDDGSQKKSWVAVDDTVDVVMTLLDKSKNIPSGVYNVTSSERWGWRDMVEIMKSMHKENFPNSDEPFTLSYEKCIKGSVGDPVNVYVSSEKLDKYYKCNRPIDKAVRETLSFIGWAKK